MDAASGSKKKRLPWGLGPVLQVIGLTLNSALAPSVKKPPVGAFLRPIAAERANYQDSRWRQLCGRVAGRSWPWVLAAGTVRLWITGRGDHAGGYARRVIAASAAGSSIRPI